MAANQIYFSVANPFHLAGVVPIRGEVIAPFQDGRNIQFASHGVTRAADALCIFESLAWPQERFARHAGPIGAIASDKVRFHDDGTKASLDGPVSDIFSRCA